MPPRKQRNLRKRKQDDVSDIEDDQEETEAVIRERLETAKVLQRQRARPSGLDTNALAIQRDPLDEALDRSEADPKNEMFGSFSKEQATDTIELDPDMQKYVDEQMEKRMGIKKNDGQERNRLRDPEAELYVTPDELKIEPIKPAEVPGSWLTGITEVQLPAHYKLKNIEETEAAKKRMLQPEATSDEEEEAFRQEQAQQMVPRGAFPRGFGREADKVSEVRKLNLLKKTPTVRKKG